MAAPHAFQRCLPLQLTAWRSQRQDHRNTVYQTGEREDLIDHEHWRQGELINVRHDDPAQFEPLDCRVKTPVNPLEAYAVDAQDEVLDVPDAKVIVHAAGWAILTVAIIFTRNVVPTE